MDLVIRHLGLQPYAQTLDAMHHFTDTRDTETPDELWVLQHGPVFTQGQAGKAEHVLANGDIPVVKSDRGGQVTYHGPGQVVVYLLLNLKRLGIGVRDLVSLMEAALVDVMAAYDVECHARKDAPGVYIGEGKLASLGLRIRRGYSFHGLALNVDMDLEPFERINPCGYPDLKMVQVRNWVPDAAIDKVEQQLLSVLIQRLGYTGADIRQGWD